MSEQQTEEEHVLFDRSNTDAAFATLMDVLAPEEGNETLAEGGAEVATDRSSEATPAPQGEGTRPAAADADPAAQGAGGDQELLGASTPTAGDATYGGADTGGGTEGTGTELGRVAGAAGDLDASTLSNHWMEISEGIETNMRNLYTDEALAEVQKELPKYFEAIRKHPRLLVGTEVPALQGEGMETLRDSADAKEWQEATKQLLAEEVNSRADRAREEVGSTIDTLHSSVDLFKNNIDLVPGTKQFNVELANRFASLVKDFETRVDGKLIGYTVPVQPLINNLRTQMKTEQESRGLTSPPGTPASQPARRGTAAPAHTADTVEGSNSSPQAGIPSRAGSSGEGGREDFSALFGTLGLPDLVI